MTRYNGNISRYYGVLFNIPGHLHHFSLEVLFLLYEFASVFGDTGMDIYRSVPLSFIADFSTAALYREDSRQLRHVSFNVMIEMSGVPSYTDNFHI